MGGQGRGTQAQSAGVVRVTTLQARSGHAPELMDAAQHNACEARAADGCLSAEVCTDPRGLGTVLVISRWESDAKVRAFLDWHGQRARGALSPYAVGGPRSVHYPASVPS